MCIRDRHAVGQAAIDRLQVLVVEGLGEQDGGDGLDQFGVADGAVLELVSGDAGAGVVFVFAAEAEDQVSDGLAEEVVFGEAAGLEDGEAGDAGFFKLAGLGQEAVALGVIDGAHVGLSLIHI